MSAGEITPQSLQFANAINEVANRDKITSSETPRTDAFLENALSAIHETETIEDFTRQLERELAAERERADRNQEDAERYRWLQSEAKQVYMHPNAEIDNRMRWEFPVLIALTCINSQVSLNAAIDAARKP